MPSLSVGVFCEGGTTSGGSPLGQTETVHGRQPETGKVYKRLSSKDLAKGFPPAYVESPTGSQTERKKNGTKNAATTPTFSDHQGRYKGITKHTRGLVGQKREKGRNKKKKKSVSTRVT